MPRIQNIEEPEGQLACWVKRLTCQQCGREEHDNAIETKDITIVGVAIPNPFQKYTSFVPRPKLINDA